MNPLTCPKCGQGIADSEACPDCGHATTNGVSRPAASAVNKPPPPPELADVVFHKPTPEQLEWARQTFNEAEYVEQVREIERTGGLELKDFIGEIEEIVNRRE